MSNIVLEAKNINKDFHDPITINVLKDINFNITNLSLRNYWKENEKI